jgi:hypothetical protein
MLFQQILQPFTYILQASDKGFLAMFVRAFSYCMKVPADKITVLEDVFKMIYNGILL